MIDADDREALARAVAARTDELFIYNGDGTNDGRWAPWPASLPADRPYAVATADGERLHTVAFDFDPKGGDPSADAAELLAILRRLGIQAVECVSGPTGGRHVLFRVIEGIDLETVQELRDRARRRFPSLDPSALSNVSRQAIRPPLAPHRTSGRSELVDVDPWEAQMILGLGNDAAQVRRLSEALPEPATRVPAEPTETTTPARNRRLTKKIRRLVRFGDTEGRYASRSEMTQAIATAYYLAGYSFEELAGDLDNPENIGGDRYRESGEEWLRRSWEKVPDFVRDNPLPDVSYLIEEAARRMATERWEGAGGVKERLVLLAHLKVATECHRQTYTASDRQISEVSGVDKKTVAKHQRSLSNRQLLSRTEVGAESQASSWILFPQLPTRLTDNSAGAVPPIDQSREAGEDFPPLDQSLVEGGRCDVMGEIVPLDINYLLENLNAEAFAHRGGLGSSTLLVLAACSESDARSVDDISMRVQLNQRTVRDCISAAEAAGLLSQIRGDCVRRDADLDALAISLGSAGRNQRRESQNRRDRIHYRNRQNRAGMSDLQRRFFGS